MDKNLRMYLDSISVGTSQVCNNLTMYPILSDYRDTIDYATFDEALIQKLISFPKRAESWHASDLRIINETDTMVLILEGETLSDASRYLVVQATTLIPARAKTIIPVRSAGRWRISNSEKNLKYNGRTFSSKIIGNKMNQIKFSLNARGSFLSDQRAIWNAIQELASDFEAKSDSKTIIDIYKKEKLRLFEFFKLLYPLENQVGAAFLINGCITGIDCFGKPETFKKIFKELVGSYAIHAIRRKANQQKTNTNKLKEVKMFIQNLIECNTEKVPSIEMGDNFQLESENVIGSALVHEGQLLQISAFEKSGEARTGRRFIKLIQYAKGT